MVNPKFHALLKRMGEIHDKKNADYASDSNPYSNFELTASIAGVSVSEVFRTMIGVKMSRLVELENSGKTPNNESLQDTREDLAVYAALMASYFQPTASTDTAEERKQLYYMNMAPGTHACSKEVRILGTTWYCTREEGHPGPHMVIDNRGGFYHHDGVDGHPAPGYELMEGFF